MTKEDLESQGGALRKLGDPTAIFFAFVAIEILAARHTGPSPSARALHDTQVQLRR